MHQPACMQAPSGLAARPRQRCDALCCAVLCRTVPGRYASGGGSAAADCGCHGQATNRELVIVSRAGVVFWAIVMGVAQTVVYKAKCVAPAALPALRII